MPARLYDWDKWFAGRRSFALFRGQDYRCSTSSMVQQIRNAAHRQGKSVLIDEQDDHLIITILERGAASCR